MRSINFSRQRRTKQTGSKLAAPASQSGQALQIEANRKRQKECKLADCTSGFGVLYF
jgi:hypothetical protein